MTWYAAHIVMVVKLKSRRQARFPVWENIVLVSAESERRAFAKAEQYGRREEGDEGGAFTWGGQPAEWIFGGVRKLTECTLPGDTPSDGTEVSYNELEFDSQDAVAQFVAGRPTRVKYNDRYRGGKSATPMERAKRARKKPA